MIRIGTCSWKYPSWSGLVYSAPKGINYLEEYARAYDSVEVDQWFWSLFAGDKVKLPDESVVAEYRQAVGDDFRFTVKDQQGKEQTLSDEQLILLNKTTSEQGEFALPFELVLPLTSPVSFK